MSGDGDMDAETLAIHADLAEASFRTLPEARVTCAYCGEEFDELPSIMGDLICDECLESNLRTHAELEQIDMELNAEAMREYEED